MAKTIYVVGGTNGVGKSTIRKDLLDSTIPYINADFIAKEMKGGQTSLMLAELAREYGSGQMKKYIAAGESFAFENNLHEAKTFQWLQQMQQEGGYRIEIFYVGLGNLQITSRRIKERVERGEHYIPPGEVLLRYESGLKLLGHYFSMPEVLVLVDNSRLPLACLQAEKGVIDYQKLAPFQWVLRVLGPVLEGLKPPISAQSLASIEEVRKLYNSQMRRD
jgi:predicted ABC-type ATPase